jgi:hypothetical protein
MKKQTKHTLLLGLFNTPEGMFPNRYDLYREPYLEYCGECQKWVIALDGHCINDDGHRTSTFTPEERKTLFVKRNWEDGPEVLY